MPSQLRRNSPPTWPDSLLLTYLRRRNGRLDAQVIQPCTGAASKLLGCMLGLAVGDVLGCPVEGMTSADIRSKYGEVQGLLTPAFSRQWRLPGLHSDDTQQALALLAALRTVGLAPGTTARADQMNRAASELARIYVRGMEAKSSSTFGCWRGTGSGFRTVVEKLGRNHRVANWPNGFAEPSAGLGAVMRIPPLGALDWGTQSIVQVAAAITQITHSDPLATSSACAIALACQMLTQETSGRLQPRLFLARLAEQTRNSEEDHDQQAGNLDGDSSRGKHRSLTSDLVAFTAEILDAEPEIALQRIAERTKLATGKDLYPTSGFAPAGVAACLYFFLHDVLSPERAVLSAINAGGDTDTIGAIVGALAGTLHGPTAYGKYLPDIIALDLIVGEVDSTFQPSASPIFDLVNEESALTALEASFIAVQVRLR